LVQRAHAFQLDVTQEERWRSVSVNNRDVGDVDIVVNNAGYFPNRSIDELDLPTWRARGSAAQWTLLVAALLECAIMAFTIYLVYRICRAQRAYL
jgi:NADP-dependent 3-hydroxy acid dehydrogenase YdfG